MKARGLGGGKVVIECDDSYSLVLTEPEHRLITGDNGSRPSRHGTLDRTIVWLIIEDLQPPPGTNQFCNFGQVHSHMRQLFPVTAEFLGENTNQFVNDRFGYQKLVLALYDPEQRFFSPPPGKIRAEMKIFVSNTILTP